MKKYLLILSLAFILALSGTAFAVGDGYSPPVVGITESFAGAGASVYSSPNYLQPQPIYPYLLQMVPGVVQDVTKDLPTPDAVQPLKDEKYVKVKTFNGWCWDRIRMEDVESEILEHLSAAMKFFGVTTTDRIRYRVGMKMSSRTIGSGGGGGGSVAGFGGGTNPVAYGSNASIMPAVAVNTADPQFVIRYYLIPITSMKKSEIDYKTEGWSKMEPKN